MSTAKKTKTTAPPPVREPMTHRQAEILAYIAGYLGQHMTPPAIRDIGERFRIVSPNGVMCHLKALAAKGYIAMTEEGHARSIRVLDLAEPFAAAAAAYVDELNELIADATARSA